MSSVTILQISPSDPNHWAYMGILRERIIRFSERYDSRLVNPEALFTRVSTQWSWNDNSVAIWIVLEETEIIGHAMITVERDPSYPDCAHIWQAWMDKNVPNVAELGMSLMEDWARRQGLEEIRAVTTRDGRAHFRSFGLETTQVIMTKKLK